MRISEVHLTNFRCFEGLHVKLDAPITLIEGMNGAGKSSILEALHYACYMRSFRALSPTQMIRGSEQAFSIKLLGTTDDESWNLTVGASSDKRHIKLDGIAVTKYEQILNRYRVTTITEEDLSLLQGYPEQRRAFLDAALFLLNPEHAILLRKYLKVVKQRNALLSKPFIDIPTYNLWTDQLKEYSEIIQRERLNILQHLEHNVNKLLQTYCETKLQIKCEYTAKATSEHLFDREKHAQRTLFGAHFDEVVIYYNDQHSRHYVSRGQQKMITLLFKIAVLEILNKPALILIDDFMTDFDRARIEYMLQALLHTKNQIIVTCPLEESRLSQGLQKYNPNLIRLP